MYKSEVRQVKPPSKPSTGFAGPCDLHNNNNNNRSFFRVILNWKRDERK